jgi:hypothetical protein
MKATSVARSLSPQFGSALLGIALVALLTACGTPASAAVTRTPVAPPSPFWCDSFWKIDASAWLDSDGNGQQDAGEPPLAGVQFNLNNDSNGESDEAGQYAFHPITGCNSLPTFTVAATPLDGYALTTPGEVQLHGNGKATFGFAAK